MTVEQTHQPYVKRDGTIVRHGVCTTEQEKDTLPGIFAPGSTIYVTQTDKDYIWTGSTWRDKGDVVQVHNHDARYDAIGHGHEPFPVGFVFISVVATNPEDLLGYGTWQAFGTGRMLVGFDAGQTEFDTVEETGGTKTVTLTANEMPAHTHVQQRFPASTGGSIGHTVDTSMSGTLTTTAQTTTSTGGGAAHANLPPYIVVHMFKRVA